MKKSFKALYKMRYLPLVLVPLLVALMVLPGTIMAASTPSLGQADSFAILSSTYTNTIGATTITGDLGYTTGPATAPTVNGTTFNPPSSQAGIDQNAALSTLNGEAPTFTFANGAIDLATDTTHGTIGVYTPGVYLINGAASIGTGGITLNGSGTYIFQIKGALTTVANSVVTLSGVSPCDVFWVPTEATTLGANSTFKGTDIDASGITIGDTVIWTGSALAYGGTVSTNNDTISKQICSGGGTTTTTSGGTTTPTTAPAPAAAPAATTTTTASSGTLTVYKVDSSGNPIVAASQASVADFDIYANEADIAANSPFQKGSTVIGTNSFSTSLQNGTYYVVEKSAPEGYDVDSVVRSVTISGESVSLTFADTTIEVAATVTTVATTPVTVTTTVTGGQIPKTGTPWYNVLFAGIILILIGAIVWITRKVYEKRSKT